MMCRDRRDIWDAPDKIEDVELDGCDSSSDELTNATKYVPTKAGSQTRFLGKAQKRVAVLLTITRTPSQGKISVIRKIQNRKKEPFYRKLTEEIVTKI